MVSLAVWLSMQVVEVLVIMPVVLGMGRCLMLVAGEHGRSPFHNKINALHDVSSIGL